MKRDILYISIILLLALFIANVKFDFIPSPCPANISVIHKTTYDTVKGDSIPYIVYKGKPKADTVKKYATILENIDTFAIISDYLLTRIYNDTFINDTSYFIAISDTLQGNSIVGRSLFFQNLRPIAINTYTTTIQQQPKHTFYAGAHTGITKAKLPVFAPSFVWANKKGRLISVNFDVINSETRLGIHFKLNK